MKNFKFDYDLEYDDLFVYSDEKSDGSIEIGDFVFDFTNDGKLVAFEIQNASENLPKISEKAMDSLSKLKSCEVEISYIKNFLILKIVFIYDNDIINANLVIPRVTEKNSALCY